MPPASCLSPGSPCAPPCSSPARAYPAASRSRRCITRPTRNALSPTRYGPKWIASHAMTKPADLETSSNRQRGQTDQLETQVEVAAEDADQTDHDQIDGHDVIQQARHQQNQDAGDQGNQGSQGEVHGVLLASDSTGCLCFRLSMDAKPRHSCNAHYPTARLPGSDFNSLLTLDLLKDLHEHSHPADLTVSVQSLGQP